MAAWVRGERAADESDAALAALSRDGPVGGPDVGAATCRQVAVTKIHGATSWAPVLGLERAVVAGARAAS